MKKLAIKSDVKNRLKKVREGIVYNDLYAVIDELIQNSQRAGATKIAIKLAGDELTIKDNGKGCSNPSTLFTLDLSGFGVGFGEGFTSIYTLADYFAVRSHDWTGTLDVKSVLDENRGELEVDIQESEHLEGFEVYLKGQNIVDNLYGLEEYIEGAAAAIPNIEITLNYYPIEKKDIFDTDYTGPYSQIVNNRKYEGKLSLTSTSSKSYIKIYFEYRFVYDLYLEGLNGTIMLKPNAVNLRTPDRRDIIYDAKRRKFIEQLSKDRKSLLKQLIQSGDESYITEYAPIISDYMDVTEYIKELSVEPTKILNQHELREEKKRSNISILDIDSVEAANRNEATEQDEINDNEEYNSYVPMSSNPLANEVTSERHGPGGVQQAFFESDDNHDNAEIELANDELEFNHQIAEGFAQASSLSVESVEAEPKQFGKRDTKRSQDDEHLISYVGRKERNTMVSKKNLNKVSIKNIKSKKNIVWVEKNLEADFSTLISEYEYYGVFTFVSPHVLFDNALTHLGIPHISTVANEAIKKDYTVTQIGARSKKEERALELLGFIEQALDLGETFNISTIVCKMTVELRNTKIYQRRLPVQGYAQGRKIQLNRKDINFSGITSQQLGKSKLNIHDMKFILANLDVIAHELAHVLYGTKDNTKEHFETQIEIQNRIAHTVINNRDIF